MKIITFIVLFSINLCASAPVHIPAQKECLSTKPENCLQLEISDKYEYDLDISGGQR